MVEGHVTGQLVQKPAAVNLRGKNGIEAIPGKLFDGVVVKEAGEVEDAADGHVLLGCHFAEGGLHGVKVGYVAGERPGVTACGPDFFNLFLLMGTGFRQMATKEPDPARAAFGEMLGKGEADIAHAARDDVGRVMADASVTRNEHVPHDNLAGMAAFKHVPESFSDGIHSEDAVRERMVEALSEAFHAAREDFAKPVFVLLADLHEVDRRVGDVVAHGLHFSGGAHVGLADFHEAAALNEAAHAGIAEILHEEVQNHVYALTAGISENLLLKIRGAGGIDVFYAPGAEQAAFAFRAGSGIDFGAHGPGDLNGGLSDAAGGGMQEDALAFLQAGHFNEGMPGSHEDRGDAGRLNGAEALRNGSSEELAGVEMGGELTVGRGEDPVAGGEAGDALADGGDSAGAVEHHALHLAGDAHGGHDVLEIEAVGFDRDLDFAGLGRVAGEGLHGDVFKAAAEDFHFVAAFGLFKNLRGSGRNFVGGAHEAR